MSKKAEKEEKNEVLEQHARFKADVERARENRQFIQTTCADARMVKILSRYEQDIEDQKEMLITSEKKDIDKLQANVVARRQLLATFKGAYDSELEDAINDLREFESANALFIAGKETVDAEAGEIKTA